ncbi:uncharacterized protein LOC134274107, partial [Saccostrea cucullata]|uniref:uncharacterized protein LOC134274107 n=1 Tax=Saccostrea cuccullata TaxID=36930 RepID=UPI002ED5D5BC
MSDPEKKMGESFPSKLEDLEKRSIRLMKDPLKRCKKSYSPEMLSKRCRTEAGQGIPGVSNFTEIKSVSTGSAKRHNLEKENGEFAKVPKIDERCTVTECQYGKAVRKSFVFLKNNIIYEDLQDALRQQDIVSEIEEAEYVCQKQSRQSMCEKLIKHIIKKKRCTVFTELMETKSKFIFERIFEACKQIQEDDAEK